MRADRSNRTEVHPVSKYVNSAVVSKVSHELALCLSRAQSMDGDESLRGKVYILSITATSCSSRSRAFVYLPRQGNDW